MKAVTVVGWPEFHLSLSSCSLRSSPRSLSPRGPSAVTSSSSTPSSSPLLSSSGVLRASLRFRAGNLPEPFLVDPYAGCFLADPDEGPPISSIGSSAYVLATSFVDGKLLETMRAEEDLRQVVLLTEGMDTRPYRLKWPRSTLIYDVSPKEVFQEASLMLRGVGAKLPRTCMLFHIPSEGVDLQDALCEQGFSGGRPSIWILQLCLTWNQGLPFATSAMFEEVLSAASALAMEGSIFLGEIPTHLIEVGSRTQINMVKWMERTFMSHGFRVDVINYNDIGRRTHESPLSGMDDNILFVARQLRLSDEQMGKWRMEFQRIEEEGDEEGFEDMIV